MSHVLIMAAADEPLALALKRCLPDSIHCVDPMQACFSFCLDSHGRPGDFSWRIGDRTFEGQEIGALVFRPGSAWQLPRRGATVEQLFQLHERRTAWCALLAAFPGPVIERLPPAWFIDPVTYSAALSTSLANQLEIRVALGSVSSIRAKRDANAGSALLIGEKLYHADANLASRDFCGWLGEQKEHLRAWQHSTGVRFVRIRGRLVRSRWLIHGVEQAPLVSDDSGLGVAAWARSIAGLVQP